MMNKRGAVHVDWAISMSIFILYTILMLIMIKPGAEVEHKPEELFTIIENSFFHNVSIEIKEVTLIIEKCLGGTESTKIELKSETFPDTSKNVFRFTELIDQNGVNIDGNPGVKGSGKTITISCKQDGDNHPGIDKKTVFTATSYPEKHINFDNPELTPRYNVDCIVQDPTADQKQKCGENGPSVGAVNEFVGISEEYIDNLFNNNGIGKGSSYGDLSESWGFPLSKRFKIETIKTKDNNKIVIYDGTEPPEGINIFVKEYQKVYLNRFNERENIKVRISVW